MTADKKQTPQKSGEKIAVVLMNLGGPSGFKTIKPFLFNFFMDKNIIQAPFPVRYLLARWISWSRSRGAALDSYSELGGISPLMKNTEAQAQALQHVLDANSGGHTYRVFVSMRYWHPMADAVVSAVGAWGADRVILLPLYPQFSTTTSYSSFQTWDKASKKQGLDIPSHKIGCYPLARGFIEASAKRIREKLDQAPAGTRLLFSAHGLPEKIIRDGDPYQWQCEKTAEAIVAALDIKDLDWEICYQSRVGPLKWIGPSTDEALEKAIREKKGVLIYPHAFVSEHVETLVEIEIEYREKAEHAGIPYFGKVETVGTHQDFIAALAELVQARGVKRQCPKKFGRCVCGSVQDAPDAETREAA